MNLLIKIVGLALIIIGIGYFLTHKPAPAPTTPPGPQPVATVGYSCRGGKTLVASFFTGSSTPSTSSTTPPTPGGSVDLKLSDGRTMTLHQTISADGARYANPDESFIFWGKGNGALILEGGKEAAYTGCILIAPDQAGQSLPLIYSNSADGFSIRLPDGYGVDEKYKYQQLGPGKDITGIKFTIDPRMATGTNLSTDSYVSVEGVPKVKTCSAALFLDRVRALNAQDGNNTFSVATSSGAAAGNRYDEIVFGVPGTNPCIAVRYYIHYGVFENYPAGSVVQFNQQALLAQFDAIRHSLVIVQ